MSFNYSRNTFLVFSRVLSISHQLFVDLTSMNAKGNVVCLECAPNYFCLAIFLICWFEKCIATYITRYLRHEYKMFASFCYNKSNNKNKFLEFAIITFSTSLNLSVYFWKWGTNSFIKYLQPRFIKTRKSEGKSGATLSHLIKHFN